MRQKILPPVRLCKKTALPRITNPLLQILMSPLRFDKGFNNLRERTSRSRYFYLACGAKLGHKLLQPSNDLKVHQNIAIQIP